MGYVVAQLGARMHYAVPRILHTASSLDHLFTDIFANEKLLKWASRLPRGPWADGLRRLSGRVPESVPRNVITAFNRFGIRYAYRQRRARSASELTRTFLWAGRTFCRHVLQCGFGTARGVY